MEDYTLEANEENVESQVIEQGGLSSTEEGFMKGYMDEEEVRECSECGTALTNSSIEKEVDGEDLGFCSKSCVQEYQEGL